MNDVRLTTHKISADALRMLRFVAAMTDEKHHEVMERLLRAEIAERLPKFTEETIAA